MILAARLAALAAILVAAACGGSSVAQQRELTLRDYLETEPAACGLGRQPVELDELGRLRTTREQVAHVLAAVKRLRGLEPKRTIRPTFVSQAEFEVRLARVIEQEFTKRDATLGQRALALLGAVPARFDLRGRILDALTASTGGFYDPDRKEVVVAATLRAKLDEATLEALAHELEHALSDQTFGLPEGRESDGWGDSALAASALVEGSATVVELRFLLALLDPFTRLFLFSVPVEAAFSFPGLPHYLARQFAFPYLEGVGFVCRLYERGGWKAVDAAFEHPPGSSAEVLFPERYLERGRPARPRGLGGLGGRWRPIEDLTGVFGAADLVALFEAPGGDPSRALDRPLERAAAWGGGRVEAWGRGDRTALGISLVERRPRGRLCESIVAWYGRAFPDAERSGGSRRALFTGVGQAALVRCRGADVLVGIAPDGATARRLVGLG